MNVRDELIDILGYDPGMVIETEAEDWREIHPDGDLSEWLEEMFRIGALR